LPDYGRLERGWNAAVEGELGCNGATLALYVDVPKGTMDLSSNLRMH